MVAMNQTQFVSSHQGGAPKGEFVCIVRVTDEQVLCLLMPPPPYGVFAEAQQTLGDYT